MQTVRNHDFTNGLRAIETRSDDFVYLADLIISLLLRMEFKNIKTQKQFITLKSIDLFI